MTNKDTLKIAIAETSTIIRSGVTVVLKRIPGMKVQPIEITTTESLYDCLRVYKPDILIINPAFCGFFDLLKFREEFRSSRIKYISLVCSVLDQSLLKNYDESVTIYDDLDMLNGKLNRLLNTPVVEEQAEQDALSCREKEIIICVVKGMTNKEIADELFLSAHTVITHRRNISRKLQIHSSAGLTIYAIVNKLVELQDIKNDLN